MQNKCQKHLFLPMKTSPPPVCPLNTRPHMYVENVPVCTGTTRTCFNTCARCAGIHGDVFNVHMGTCLSGHTGFFSAFHTTPQHRTHHTDHTPHHDTRHNTTRRQTETDRDRDRGRRGDEREDDKTRAERREKSEEREDSFSVWWCMAVFYWCSDFPVNYVCARDLSLLNSVQ